MIGTDSTRQLSRSIKRIRSCARKIVNARVNEKKFGYRMDSKQDLLRRSRATAGSGKRNVRLGVWKVGSCQASFYLAADLTLGTLMGELGL
jgi:hypothetical protein